MPIFFQPDFAPAHVLSPEESKHVCRVLRMKEGDHLTVVDGKGNLYECSIALASNSRCELTVVSTELQPWPKHSLKLVFAPTKNMDRNEWLVEKAVEIGIDEIQPIICNHSERRMVKTERLLKTAISAMKQSQKAWLPKVNEAQSFTDFIKNENSDHKLICKQDQDHITIDSLEKGDYSYCFLVGPEGDFSQAEFELAKEIGFIPTSLGPHRLRTETAGLVAVTQLNAHLNA